MLLAGPGTGKTTRVKEIIEKRSDLNGILVVSFTNATINDLRTSFAKKDIKIDPKSCITLHKLAYKLNNLRDIHVLSDHEQSILKKYAEKMGVNEQDLYNYFNCTTFDDMVTKSTSWMKLNPEYVTDKLGPIKLLIVDEFQDFNSIEANLIYEIAKKADDTLILGDDDQCIYSFKQAKTTEIINLYNNGQITKLSHDNICYRCPKDVVLAGNKLISKNKYRVAKKWQTYKDCTGISYNNFRTQQDTNNYVVNQIKEIRSTSNDESILILSNMHILTKPIIDTLKVNNIPYVSKDSVEVCEYEKELLLKIIFGDKKLLNLLFLYSKNLFKKQNILKKLKDVITTGKEESLLIEMINNIPEVSSLLKTYSNKEPDLEKFFDENTEYLKYKEQLSKTDNINRELEKLNVTNGTSEIVKDKVNIMSIHNSKGLSADHVFMIGLVDGFMPIKYKTIEELEDSRRVMFVGMTRSEKTLHLMSQVEWDVPTTHKGDFSKFACRGKVSKGSASPFIAELELSL